MNYYNENDPFTAQWLRNLIAAELIPDGHVDDRSIKEVQANDLEGFTQCHFFAGIAGWSLALEMAGWPEDAPVWTGSCPCQPFSAAGKRKGIADERHLWPEFHRLIAKCKPAIVFGEQVAGPDGRAWLAGVRADLEALGYAVGGVDLCAASISAPHARQRLYWVGESGTNGRQAWNPSTATARHGNSVISASGQNSPGMGFADRYHKHWWSGPLQVGWNAIKAEIERGGRKVSAQWRVKPGLSIVAHGVPGRVGAICGAGNAIVPQVAAEFIGAYLETLTPPPSKG